MLTIAGMLTFQNVHLHVQWSGRWFFVTFVKQQEMTVQMATVEDANYDAACGFTQPQSGIVNSTTGYRLH